MINTKTEKQLIDFLYWLMAVFALVIILTGCSSPMAGLFPTFTPTTSPAATATADPASEVTTLAPDVTCSVATGYDNGRLNLRSGPGTQYAVIRLLQEGEALTVLEHGAWLKVIDHQGKGGYVHSRYCQVES